MIIPTIYHTKTIPAMRVSSPQLRKETDGSRTPLCTYVDMAAFPQAPVASDEVFKEIAGRNSEGDIPSGMDREMHCSFNLLIDDNQKDAQSGMGMVVGLDVVPDRRFLRNTFPSELQTVTAVTIEFSAGGAVWKVTKRPPKMRPEAINSLVKNLRAIAAKQAAERDAALASAAAAAQPLAEGEVPTPVAAREKDPEGAELIAGSRLPRDLGRVESISEAMIVITPKLSSKTVLSESDEVENYTQDQ